MQRDAKVWRFQKPAEKFGNFYQNQYIFTEPKLGKNTFSQEILDMQKGNLKNLKKQANIQNILAQSPKNLTKN